MVSCEKGRTIRTMRIVGCLCVPDFEDPDSDGDGFSDRDEAGDDDISTPPTDKRNLCCIRRPTELTTSTVAMLA